MNSGIRSLAKELTDALEQELSRQQVATAAEQAPAPATGPSELFDLLVSVLADRVALELQGRQNGHEPAGPDTLLNLARRMRDQAQSSRSGDTEEQAEGSAAADGRIDIRDQSPKYANIESLLRYDETREIGPGVKLVIMNFND